MEGFSHILAGLKVRNTNSVGILLSKKAKNSLIEWHPVSERIINAHFKAKVRNVSIVQCYVPTEISEIETKKQFYQCLNETMKMISRRDIIIVMGNMNAKVGVENEGLEQSMGRHGLGEMNEHGELFTEFCAFQDLVTGVQYFPTKSIMTLPGYLQTM
jgi:exonuclease III